MKNKNIQTYKCNVCKNNVVKVPRVDKYNVGGKEIIFTYIKCNKCNMKYGFSYDDILTKELRAKINRYIDMKIDKDIIKGFRIEHTNAMSNNEEILKGCNEYINDELIYYNYKNKIEIKN